MDINTLKYFINRKIYKYFKVSYGYKYFKVFYKQENI